MITVGASLFFTGIASIISGVAARGGLLFSVFGIAVVTRSGKRASRLGNLWRVLVTWSVLFTLLPLLFPLARYTPIPIALFLVGAVYAVVAKRSLQDRLAGTCLDAF